MTAEDRLPTSNAPSGVLVAVGTPLCADVGEPEPEPVVLEPGEPEEVEPVVVPAVLVVGALTSILALG
jgi:hypothetical protein